MSQGQIETVIPRLTTWLNHVFRVLGGFIVATGILMMALAARESRTGSAVAVATAGALSIGLMTAVNSSIGSDFRWALLALAVLWVCCTVLYGIEASRLSGRSADQFPAELRRYERAILGIRFPRSECGGCFRICRRFHPALVSHGRVASHDDGLNHANGAR